MSATYGFDFADRQDGLTVTTPTETDKTIASGAIYLPSGPLSAVTLGNGVTEARSYDTRYAPDRVEITAPFERDWIYSTDPVGNVSSITEQIVCASRRWCSPRTPPPPGGLRVVQPDRGRERLHRRLGR